MKRLLHRLSTKGLCLENIDAGLLTREKFARQIRALGIGEGDVLYIRAALGPIGKMSGDIYDTVIGGLSDAVGASGTLMAPAFTKVGNIFSKEKTVFTQKSAPYSGAISKLFLKHPNALRSFHPSHSFVAFGPRAKELLAGHTPHASCFSPVKKLAEMNGKMLLLGCNNDSPGFSTVHVAQFDLGLSQRHLIRHMYHGWIQEGDRLVSWRPIESPGCSASFDKFYPAYIRDQNFITGFVGKAFAILVPSTQKALEADTAILKRDPRFVDCGDPACLTCGFRTYQLTRIPRTLIAATKKRLLHR